jgi:hypothetical protein
MGPALGWDCATAHGPKNAARRLGVDHPVGGYPVNFHSLTLKTRQFWVETNLPTPKNARVELLIYWTEKWSFLLTKIWGMPCHESSVSGSRGWTANCHNMHLPKGSSYKLDKNQNPWNIVYIYIIIIIIMMIYMIYIYIYDMISHIYIDIYIYDITHIYIYAFCGWINYQNYIW